MAKKRRKKKKKEENKKILRYRKPLNLNIGMLIFAVIFIYMVFSVCTYITKKKVQPYEVAEGSIVNDKSFTGIILRHETTAYTENAGYLNYYIREGKRAAAGASVCSIDETGRLASLLEELGEDQMSLSTEDLAEVKKQLSVYSLSYSDNKFDTVYDTRYSLEAMVLEYVNFNALENQELLMDQLEGNFKQVKTDVSGVISYAIDSYEGLDPSQISAEVFDRSNYSRSVTKAGKQVEPGTPVYKIITDDLWSVVFPLEERDMADFGGETSLDVKFAGHDLTARGSYSMITGADGKPYGKLDFDKYMVQFVSERYLDFEVITSTTEGLKIPVSSVTSKNFYLIPTGFLTTGGDSTNDGFNKEVYSETGEVSIVFVPTVIYYSTEEYCYIDAGEDEPIRAGDYLVKPDSTERCQVGQTASLEGVYNINKGYAVFKQIEILSQNDEFYTVKKGTKYGLNVYDHIVMDASVIEKEGVLIYQ